MALIRCTALHKSWSQEQLLGSETGGDAPKAAASQKWLQDLIKSWLIDLRSRDHAPKMASTYGGAADQAL